MLINNTYILKSLLIYTNYLNVCGAFCKIVTKKSVLQIRTILPEE